MPIKSASKRRDNLTPGVWTSFTPGVETINRHSRGERSSHLGSVRIDLTISIVSFNTKALLKRCLSSIYKFTKGLNFEVIVVDNASTDGSAAMVKRDFSQVQLIANKVNRWYTGANNQALCQSQGKYFLILNSDIFLKNNAFKLMVDYLNQHPQVGAIEPIQKYEDGRIVITCSRHNSLWLDLAELTLLHRLVKPKGLTDFRLKQLDRRKTWRADVICDAAFMVRTAVLKRLNGYDENLKLYYTENDLCRRLQVLGLTAVHFSGATVWHRVSASTDKAGWRAISPVFSHDALVYYRKYHSFLSAWTLFLSMKLSNLLILGKQNFWLILILLLATWLRFYRLPETMTFIGDQGRDYLAARDMVLTGNWPLVGIASSVPWLKQGPFFIWLTALVFKVFGFNPVNPAIMTAVLGVVTVYLVYRFSHSRLAALVMATSPLVVIHSRMAYHISPIPLFTILYLMALNSQSVLVTFLLTGILLQFELTTLPLLFLATIYFYRKRLKIFPAILIGLVPFGPKFIYDLSHGFLQTVGFAAWAVHRLVELRPPVTILIVSQTIWLYWQRFISWNLPLPAIIFAAVAIFSLFKHKLLLSFLIINLVAFYLHAGPSEAYFPVLFPVWAIALSLIRPKIIKVLIIGLCFFNIWTLMSKDFLTSGPILSERVAYVKLILAKKEPFFLKNPAGVPFPSFLDNYRYLIWWQGGKEDATAKTSYTFFE